MRKNPSIHEFSPVIYPIRLWVAHGEMMKYGMVSKRFETFNGDELPPLSFSTNARTASMVIEKETRNVGLFVYFVKCTVGDIAHEATHIAREIWKYLGEETTGEEADAYLVQWIANSIEEARRCK